MFSCVLCEKEWMVVHSLCEKCRRIKHLINLYDDKVYSTLENCLVRNQDQIVRKENIQIKEEKKELENVIETRSKKK
jgi:tyrosine-protein phosphatase YwqE